MVHWICNLELIKTGTVNADEIIAYPKPGTVLPIYSSNLTVYGLDEYHNNKIQWDYIGAFPTQLSEIQWDYNSDSEIAATATFEFTRLEAKLL